MSNKVTLGGDRLGSGNKQQLELHSYYRSTHNLSQQFKSSLAPGILYPFCTMVGLNGDTFDIDMDSLIRTLPTKGPLFGSFKFQCDWFSIPMRLYQGVLHNNPVGIGMQMSKVLFPTLRIEHNADGEVQVYGSDKYTQQINTTSLLKYLGMSGLAVPTANSTSKTVYREINAIPALGYYDIFKNYYANKQEQKAYVIVPDAVTEFNGEIQSISYTSMQGTMRMKADEWSNLKSLTDEPACHINIIIKNAKPENIYLNIKSNASTTPEEEYGEVLSQLADDQEAYVNQINENQIQVILDAKKIATEGQWTGSFYKFSLTIDNDTYETAKYTADIKLQEFDLDNIDKMRNELLAITELNQNLEIGSYERTTQDLEYYPYKALIETTATGISYNAFTENGLVVKTYQSDLFNNWIQTDWIEGENGIAALSAVAIQDGKFEIDALNLAQKVYDMLNRIAVSGGTWDDWQEAVYDEKAIRRAETPIYHGSMSSEVLFDEVVSTAETEVQGDYQALGSIGGRGKEVNKEGGHITIDVKEPCFIMGICSLTPRICYTQGNEWYLTELRSIDDLHKPALDGIGFQDLMVEQMAWWDVHQRNTSDIHGRNTKNTAGKVPAWINYMTAYDKAFGDFANAEGKSFMVLSRNYTWDETDDSVADVTTYIDPAKYNYAFAYTDLAAQNFWCHIYSKIIARRKMSAKQIPNL